MGAPPSSAKTSIAVARIHGPSLPARAPRTNAAATRSPLAAMDGARTIGPCAPMIPAR
jgi:hypothetical protein